MSEQDKGNRQEFQKLTEPRYYSRMPFVADDELTKEEYRLYGHYLRRAGNMTEDNKADCYEKVETTARHCDMSHHKVRQARQGLADKGYIHLVFPANDTVKIYIIPIWERNNQLFDDVRDGKRPYPSLEEIEAMQHSEPLKVYKKEEHDTEDESLPETEAFQIWNGKPSKYGMASLPNMEHKEEPLEEEPLGSIYADHRFAESADDAGGATLPSNTNTPHQLKTVTELINTLPGTTLQPENHPPHTPFQTYRHNGNSSNNNQLLVEGELPDPTPQSSAASPLPTPPAYYDDDLLGLGGVVAPMTPAEVERWEASRPPTPNGNGNGKDPAAKAKKEDTAWQAFIEQVRVCIFKQPPKSSADFGRATATCKELKRWAEAQEPAVSLETLGGGLCEFVAWYIRVTTSPQNPKGIAVPLDGKKLADYVARWWVEKNQVVERQSASANSNPKTWIPV